MIYSRTGTAAFIRLHVGSTRRVFNITIFFLVLKKSCISRRYHINIFSFLYIYIIYHYHQYHCYCIIIIMIVIVVY